MPLQCPARSDRGGVAKGGKDQRVWAIESRAKGGGNDGVTLTSMKVSSLRSLSASGADLLPLRVVVAWRFGGGDTPSAALTAGLFLSSIFDRLDKRGDADGVEVARGIRRAGEREGRQQGARLQQR